tara:strand:- start:272 stop:373 length:102 start_codon:yes stop_codon:yes gene_type:complete
MEEEVVLLQMVEVHLLQTELVVVVVELVLLVEM